MKLLSFRKWLKKVFEMSPERFSQMDDDFQHIVYKQYDQHILDWEESRRMEALHGKKYFS